MNDLLETLADLVQNRYFGKYRGLVTGHEFPATRGRIKVKVPAVLGDLELLAEPCVPYAGAGVGFLMLPETDTGVWVEFEGGDPSYPIWVGFFWGDGGLPSVMGTDQKVIITEQNDLVLDDAGSNLKASSSGGASVTIDDKVTAQAGLLGGTVEVSSSGVTASKGIGKVEVTDASVSVNSGALEVT